LAGAGHHLPVTRNGPLDVLGEIGLGHDFKELEASSEQLVLRGGQAIRFLSLEWIIRTKEEVGGPKDLATLDLLRAALAENRKRASGDPDPQ
jgi:hypothetical protein